MHNCIRNYHTEFEINRTIKSMLKLLGCGALSGNMLLIRIVEDDKIDAYFYGRLG